MVDWADIPDRNRGQKRPRYSANVAPIRPGQDDARSAYLRNSFIDSVNDTRKKRATRAATVDNPQWAMSRSADWYQNRDNLASIKDTLVNQQGNRDFLTTDQNESRNMYQMLMNQMKGGDKGARMLDTRGLPAGARRIGRTLFQDPSKSQGFFGDIRSMAGDIIPGISRKPNPAAVRATEYNPFPKAGFGEQFYKDEFPFASSFGNLMGLAEKSPTLSMLARLFPKKERIPLERDLSWVPENVGAYNEIPEIPFMGDELVDEEQTFQEKYNIPNFFPMSRDFAPEFTTADLPLLERFPDIGKYPSISENLDEVGFWDRYDIPTDAEEVLDDETTNNIDVEIKEKPPFPADDTFDPEIDGDELVEESFNNQYSFINENPDLTPYEWVMIMRDETGATMEQIIQNGILQGIIIEN